MNRERSYIETSGMPLHNAGRMRRARNDAPWFNTFDARGTQVAEQKPPGMAILMPEPGDEKLMEGAEGERQPRTQAAGSELLAAPNLLQRAAADGSGGTQSAGANQTSVNQPSSRNAPAAGADAQPNAAVSAAMGPSFFRTRIPGDPAMTAALPGSIPASGRAMQPAGGSEDGIGSPSIRAGASHEAVAPALPPRVLVQKHITIQTSVSSISAQSEGTAPMPAGAALPMIEALQSPMSISVPPDTVATETGSIFMPGENFTAAAPQAAPSRFDAVRVEMGAGNTASATAVPPVIPTSQPPSERSQQALFDRLNHRPAQQQEGGGRRVHIGNLHITVHRPAMAAQAPPSTPSAQPQQQPAAPQTLFNPWERHNVAFD